MNDWKQLEKSFAGIDITMNQFCLAGIKIFKFNNCLNKMAEARIDKWMWAVRIFKTRTIAAEACKKGRITINGSLVKAARMVKPGDVIQVKKPPITYSFKYCRLSKSA